MVRRPLDRVYSESGELKRIVGSAEPRTLRSRGAGTLDSGRVRSSSRGRVSGVAGLVRRVHYVNGACHGFHRIGFTLSSCTLQSIFHAKVLINVSDQKFVYIVIVS